MEYQLNLGAWNSVFVVPSILVDQHIKLAGAVQLKVILWVLRHAGESFSTDTIAQALSMHEADVKDCMQYWTETGIICLHEQMITPAAISEPVLVQKETTVAVPSAETESSSPDAKTEKESNNRKRALSRPEKPDMKYLTQRMNEDESIAFLMRSADEIFGRMTSNSDKETLLMIHEYDGLPVDVLIMLLQYALSVGKCNMRYIEKMAITWSDEDITTLQAAENKIKQLNLGRDAAKHIQRLFGLSDRSPSEKEKTLADLWINQWQLPDELIREAYEICINNNGKYVPQYIGTTLESWYSAGVTNVSQIKREEEPDKKTHKRKKKDGYQPSYNIEEYESTSVLDEEWDD